MTKRFASYTPILIGALLLSACTAGILQNSENSIRTNQQKAEATKNLAKDEEQIVRSKPGIYYDTTPVKLQNDPAWMQTNVRVRGNGLPFSFYVEQLTKGTPAQVRYQTEVTRNAVMDFSYNGSLKGALDAISDRLGLVYEINDNVLLWKAFETRTFNISFMPGSTKYMVGSDSSQASDQSQQNSSQSNLVTMGSSNIADSQYTNLTGDFSIWKDLEKTLDSLKSKDGKAIVSEATTTVTVYDHPENIRSIARYLEKLNKELSQQVALNVQVLQVDLYDGFRFGIDWNYLNHKYSFGGTYDNANTLEPLGGFSTSAKFPNPDENNPSASALQGAGLSILHGNPRFLIDSLGQMGKVTTVTEPRVVTLNNQVAQIKINQQQSYLAEVSQTITQTGGTTSGSVGGATETLTPGVVTTGFSIYLLPKIQGRNVYLQITSGLSTLSNLAEVQSQASGSGLQIQVPTIDAQNFNQRAIIPTNATLLLSGFKQIKNQANEAGPFGIVAAGGQAAQTNNIETVILITPSILKAEG